jgi:hypothetical protein
LKQAVTPVAGTHSLKMARCVHGLPWEHQFSEETRPMIVACMNPEGRKQGINLEITPRVMGGIPLGKSAPARDAAIP